MEIFYCIYVYFVEYINVLVCCDLMDEINWSDCLIGIKGICGVGKIIFLF